MQHASGSEEPDNGSLEANTLWLTAGAETGQTSSADDLPQPVSLFGKALGQLRQPEQFVFPAAGDDWLHGIGWLDNFEGFRQVVEQFQTDLKRWCAAAVLPIDELILTLGQDLFTEAPELALAHSVAILLAKQARERPELRLPELTSALEDIANNRRRILGFGEETRGFEPPKGKVTVATMHTAKGLNGTASTWPRSVTIAFPAAETRTITEESPGSYATASI